MKEINELNFAEDVKYTENHEWARQKGNVVQVGISDYAQDQLGDIVFVELPEVGSSFSKGEEFGTVESVKAVSELYMPVGGEITAVNGDLEGQPELLNKDPYAGGWLIEIRPNDQAEMDPLMDKDAYLEMLKG